MRKTMKEKGCLNGMMEENSSVAFTVNGRRTQSLLREAQEDN